MRTSACTPLYIIIIDFHRKPDYCFIESSISLFNDLSAPIACLILFPVLVGFVSPTQSIWLARFGNYKVFRVSAVLLIIATVMNCLFPNLQMQILKIDNILMCMDAFMLRLWPPCICMMVVVHVLLLLCLSVWIKCLMLHPQILNQSTGGALS